LESILSFIAKALRKRLRKSLVLCPYICAAKSLKYTKYVCGFGCLLCGQNPHRFLFPFISAHSLKRSSRFFSNNIITHFSCISIKIFKMGIVDEKEKYWN